MKTARLTKVPFFVVSIALFSGFLLWFWVLRSKPIENQNTTVTTDEVAVDNSAQDESNIAGVKDEEEELINMYEAGYIAYWDYAHGIEHYEEDNEQLKEVLPTWYSISSDGELATKSKTACSSALVSKVHDSKDIILPSISNSSAKELSEILNNPRLADKLINEIVSEIEKCGYDGIDIDFEKISSTDKATFSQFVCTLGEALHKSNKKLSIAVLPKTGSPTSLVSGTRTAQDWAALGVCVDEFKIMTYDYTNSSEEAGSNSPNYWLLEIAEYAISNVEKGKIQIGLPYYAFVWEADKEGTDIVKMQWEIEDMFDSGERTKLAEVLDHEAGELVLTYEKDGKTYVTYWNSEEELEEKQRLLNELGITSCFYWRL